MTCIPSRNRFGAWVEMYRVLGHGPTPLHVSVYLNRREKEIVRSPFFRMSACPAPEQRCSLRCRLPSERPSAAGDQEMEDLALGDVGRGLLLLRFLSPRAPFVRCACVLSCLLRCSSLLAEWPSRDNLQSHREWWHGLVSRDSEAMPVFDHQGVSSLGKGTARLD